MPTPPTTPAPTTPAPLIPQARIEADRVVAYEGASAAVQKQSNYLQSLGSNFDEEGNEAAPVTPEAINALHKAVGLMMVLAPLPGERGHIPVGAQLDRLDAGPPEPKTLDEIKHDLQTIKFSDHSGNYSGRKQASKKRKETKAG